MSLLVVTGPPGAGKTTVANLLVERFEPSVLVDGDAFFGFLRRGAIAPWLPESATQNDIVTSAAAAATARYAERGYVTVYDGICGPWYIDHFARSGGIAELDYVILLPEVERCVKRVVTRIGHGFQDEAATRQMHAQFAAAAIDPRHVLADLPDTIDEVADLVLALRAAGTLRYTPS